MKLKKNDKILIGERIKIDESKNETLKGIKGKVIDQTKNTITVQTDRGAKKIIKSHVKIKNEE